MNSGREARLGESDLPTRLISAPGGPGTGGGHARSPITVVGESIPTGRDSRPGRGDQSLSTAEH
jgi:hypothetical protein